MNFLSLRNQLGSWTLDSDDKLYRAIKQLSDTVLDAQKLILNNIQSTRYEITRGQVESGCSYNHYLRISQTKFTENKIGQKRPQQVKEANAVKVEARNKMDVFKEAIDIGAKNLQITEEKGADNDLISMSDTSLSQSIYKDCRLPAFYGTKQFATNSFLNLFTETQLNAAVPCQKFQTNELVVGNQLQQQLLPPPPSLQTSLNQNVGSAPTGLLPPPPPLDLLPPTLPTLPPLSSLGLPAINTLPQLPPLVAQKLQPLPPPLLPPLGEVAEIRSQQNVNVAEQDNSVNNNLPLAPPSQKSKQPLSMQEQLALRLKHGKNYKKQIQQVKVEKVQPQPDNIKKQQVTIVVNNSNNDNNNKLPQITEQRQSVDSNANVNIRASLRDSYGGINLNPLASNPIQQTTKQVQREQPQQEEVDTFFGPAKNKNRETKRVVNLDNDIMKRQTFNEDILFKKKPLPEKKEVQKPKNTLFAQGSDDQSLSIAFKKKQEKPKPALIPPPPPAEKVVKKEVGKKKGLLDSDSDEDLFKKKTDTKSKQPLPQPVPTVTVKVEKEKSPAPVVPVPQKKQLNPLFKPSDPKPEVEIKVTNQQSSLAPPKSTVEQASRKSSSQLKQDDERSEVLSSRDKASNYAMKAAAAGGMGMMGMPLLPKGMSITRPSQAKKNEQQALQRIKKQQQQEKKAREEEQRRIQIERKQQQQRRQQQRKRIQQQNARRALQQEQKKKHTINQQIPKLPTIPKVSTQSPQKSKNSLFNDDDEEEDFFKSKPKKLTQHSQYEAPAKTKVQNLRQTQYIPSPAVQSQKIQKVQQNKITLPVVKIETTEVQADKITVERTESMKTQLTTRRKKAKPTMNTQQFFGAKETDVIVQAPVTQIKQQPPKKDSLSYAQKISKAGGVGPQMPILPKGMAFTKPSQAKLQEQAALQKIKKQQQQKEEQKRIEEERKRKQQQQKVRIQQQQQRIRVKQQQQKRLAQKLRKQEQQKARQLEKLRKQQQQRQKQLQEQRIRKLQQKQKLQRIRMEEQQQRRKQEQRQRIYEENKRREEQQRRRKQQERRKQQQRRLRQQQQEKLRRKQQERRQQAQRQQKRRLQQIRREEEEARARQIEEEKRKIEQSKKQPLAPFLPKLPTRSQPLGLGPLGNSTLPKLPAKTNQNTTTNIAKKGIIFNDDDDQPQLNFNKSSKPATNALNKPTGLSSNTGGEKKKRLFDQDDDLDDNFLVGKKTPAQQPKPVETKQPASKLFNNEDQQVEIKVEKKTQPILAPTQPIKEVLKSNPMAPAAKKKSLFDEDDDFDFIKKPAQKKVQPAMTPKIKIQQQPAPVSQKAPLSQPLGGQKPAQSKKKGLFDDDDDDDGFLNIKKAPQTTTQTHSISPVPKQTISPSPAANTNKRNLFADSDSDQDSYTAKQQQKKKEAAKKVRQFN